MTLNGGVMSCVCVLIWISMVLSARTEGISCHTDLSSLSQSASEVIARFLPSFHRTSNNSESLVLLMQAIKKQNMSPLPEMKNCTSNPALVRLCEPAEQCLPVDNLLESLPASNATSLDEAFVRLCPILLLQAHHKSCHFEPHLQDNKLKLKPETFQVWLYGIVSVTLISMCSLTGLLIVPLLTKQLYHKIMMVFQGLAVGSLCGSAVFHLIPQAFNLVEQDGYLWKSLVVFSGIYFFYVSERMMKVIAECRRGEKNKVKAVIVSNQDDFALVDSHGHSHNTDGSIASVAWLIIFGDGMHNFIDGLSLGAAFNKSVLGGISISVAVVCEEFPHELGDFAVLLAAGMSAKQAVLYNFLSALTCFLGLAVGILVGDLTQGTPAIFAFAGGMFLYISLVGMMGEINDAVEKVAGVWNKLSTFGLQNIGILAGVSAMFLMARYSEDIDFEGISLSSEDSHVLSQTLSNLHLNAKTILP